MGTLRYKAVNWLAAAAVFSMVGTACGWSANSAAPPASGADTFKAKCAMCHGADGSGNNPMGQRLKVRDLRSPEVQKQTDEELTNFIVNGKPPMPAYGKTLTSGEIHELVLYIRSIASKS